MGSDLRTGPGGCHAAVIIRGEHFWCDGQAPHTGWPHGSTAAETIWRGTGPAEDPADITKVTGCGYSGCEVLCADPDCPAATEPVE